MKKKVIPLSKELAIEYVLAVATGLLILVVIPLVAESYLDGRPSGLDNIGEALAIALVARAAYALLALAFLIVNPLRVFITQRKYINLRYKGFTKALKYIMILLPIIPALFVVFRVPISNALYDLKYNYSPDSRTVSEYKTAKDFEKELEKRGLLNNDNTARLVQQLNKKYEPSSLNSSQYYYEEPKLMAISDNTVYTESTNAKAITFDSTTTAPIYMYNALLVKTSVNENLQYMPVSRNGYFKYANGNFYPFYEDYYIDLRIFYADGDIYAMVGPDGSYAATKNYHVGLGESYPFSKILAERDTVTTFVDGKYYPNGAIEDRYSSFTFRFNTNQQNFVSIFPVVKVDELNIISINKKTKKMQDGELKGDIDSFFSSAKD